MATVSLATLKARVLDRADLTGSDFIDDTQLTAYINDAIAELYDLLVVQFQDYFLKKQTIAVTASTDTYALSTVFTDGDFYKLIKMYALLSDTRYPLRTFTLDDYDSPAQVTAIVGQYRLLGDNLVFSPTPAQSTSVEAWYIPMPDVLVADADEITWTVPVGWMEYIVVSAAIRCLAKEESDTSELKGERERIRMRIIETSERDTGEPRKMRDVYRRGL